MKAIATVLILVLLTGSLSAQGPCPTFPTRGTEIIDLFVAQNLMLAHGDDEQRRTLTRIIAEQMRFELGAWSTKSAGPGRPPSKDSVALPMGASGAFCNWDWQNGITRRRHITDKTVGEYITDQILLPTDAVNRLGAAPVPTPTPQPSPSPPSTSTSTSTSQPIPSIDLTGVYARLQAQYDQLERVYADLAAKSNQISLEVKQVDAHLAEHDAKTSKALELLKNPLIYTLIGGLLAGKFAFGSQQQ